MSVENMKVPAGQSPSHAQDDDDEFDAAMAEATADEGAPAHAAADPDSDGPASGTDEPPVPAGSAATQATPAAGNAPSGNPEHSDIWANAPPELKAAYEQERRDAELRFKSVQGRQSAADRELERLRAEHAELQRRMQSEPSAKEGKQGASESQAPTARDKAVEDYPEIAGPLVEDIKRLESQLSQVQQGVGTFQQEREQTFYKQQQDLLTEKQPDWLTVLGDERFGGWLQEQPKAVQETFERNSQRASSCACASTLAPGRAAMRRARYG